MRIGVDGVTAAGKTTFADELARLHGGTLALEGSALGGLCVRVCLPVR